MSIETLEDNAVFSGLRMIDGVKITPLAAISVPGGDVLHAMKSSDSGYVGFGEAYFSIIQSDVVKAWKRHRDMHLNLVVPVGEVKFVLFDDRNIAGNGEFQEIILSRENYFRLTVPPMVWFGFQGLAHGDSMLLNMANIEHLPDEVDRKAIDQISYDWSKA